MPDNVFISGGNLHLASRFCSVESGSTQNSKRVAEPIQAPLGHQVTVLRPLGLRSRSPVLGIRVCVKNPTSDEIRSDNVFISRFCRVELGLTQNSKM